MDNPGQSFFSITPSLPRVVAVTYGILKEPEIVVSDGFVEEADEDE